MRKFTLILTLITLVLLVKGSAYDIEAKNALSDFNFKNTINKLDNESSFNEEVGLALFNNRIRKEVNGACEALLNSKGVLKVYTNKGKEIASYILEENCSYFKFSTKNIKPGEYKVELLVSNLIFTKNLQIN